MSIATAAVLEPVNAGDNIALETVDVQANLKGLFSDVVLTQVYRNTEESNIEAIYTFPLPSEAVLLDLSLELNGRTMRGLVRPRTQAEERYEHAIEEGDTAVLLEQSEPGIFTFHVGNILPNEKAEIKLRYAQVHRWMGNSFRLHLPTTIAPRYGDPASSGFAPYQVPEHVLSADYGFSLVVRVSGVLVNGKFDCPSHPLSVSTKDKTTEFSISGGWAIMDRDFVLNIKEPEDSTVEAICTPDGDEYVTLASFHPVAPDALPKSPHCLKLVVDCSGSMGGDSIAQAKTALREIISMLKQNDIFNVIAFGSKFKLLFPEPVIASESNIKKATQFVEHIDANMGGTEIGAALNAAYKCGKIEGSVSDILLITDGQVWGLEQLVDEGQKSGHRLFTVGVGHSVSEAFVRSISESTSGACELVSPQENMSERIVRHFQRIDQPMAQSVQINWPSDVVRQVPNEIKTVYAGDTLHVYGWFQECPVGDVELVVTFESGHTVTQKASLSTEFTTNENLLTELPRVAAYTRLPDLNSKEYTDLALHHQLVTEHTSFILVFDRAEVEKFGEIPELRTIPHVLAAGWGGIDNMKACAFSVEPIPPRSPSLRHSRVLYNKTIDAKPVENVRYSVDPMDSEKMTKSQEEFKRPGFSDRTFDRLKKGKIWPDVNLYIKDQTAENLTDQLKQFIAESIRSGYRCIKIIHCANINLLDKNSWIKHECQNYLILNGYVLAYCQALPNYGGAGAMYVLLEKRSQRSDDELSLYYDVDREFKKPGLVNRNFSRLKKGKIIPRAKLIIHGQSADEVIYQSKQFIAESVQSGHGCVKIIHCSDINLTDKNSWIKHECQNYLISDELVRAYCQALPNDGGAGAMYVLL